MKRKINFVICVLLAIFVEQTLFAGVYETQFKAAMKKNDLSKMEGILKKSKDKIDLDDCSALVLTRANNFDNGLVLDALRLLSESGASFDENVSISYLENLSKKTKKTKKTKNTKNGNSILITDTSNKRVGLIDLALNEKIEPQHSDKIIRYLVENGGWNNWGNFVSLLINNKFDLAKLCLQKGFSIDQQSDLTTYIVSEKKYWDYNNVTPLFVMARYGNLDAVKFLIENKANMNKTVKKGYLTLSPLGLAEEHSKTNVVDYLVSIKAVSINDYDYAAEARDREIAAAEAAQRAAEAARRAEQARQAAETTRQMLETINKGFNETFKTVTGQ